MYCHPCDFRTDDPAAFEEHLQEEHDYTEVRAATTVENMISEHPSGSTVSRE